MLMRVVIIFSIYVDELKVTSDVRAHLGAGSEQFVTICQYSDFVQDLASLVQSSAGKVWVSVTNRLCFYISFIGSKQITVGSGE